MTEFAHLRHGMVDVQLARRGIRDRRVLNAMKQIPREQFVESGLEEFAYEDGALPIANGQTISQPYIVALMSEAAELKPPDKVLEVGTGSGYAAAVASRLAKTVHTIERHEDLVRIAWSPPAVPSCQMHSSGNCLSAGASSFRSVIPNTNSRCCGSRAGATPNTKKKPSGPSASCP